MECIPRAKILSTPMPLATHVPVATAVLKLNFAENGVTCPAHLAEKAVALSTGCILSIR